jgi:hypothetical protein
LLFDYQKSEKTPTPSYSPKNTSLPVISASGAGFGGEFWKWLQPDFEPIDFEDQQKLFNAIADAKILVSKFAMHLDRERQQRLFRQLDSLHDPQEMEDGDQPLKTASFDTFIRAILYLKPAKYPSLGMSFRGDLIGAWTEQSGRLTIEFRPNDEVQWVLSRHRHNKPIERVAGDTTIDRLPDVLAPYNPEQWFDLGAEATAT